MPVGPEAEEVWRSRDRGFQMGVVEDEGVVVHLTGQVSWSADVVVDGKGDVEA